MANVRAYGYHANTLIVAELFKPAAEVCACPYPLVALAGAVFGADEELRTKLSARPKLASTSLPAALAVLSAVSAGGPPAPLVLAA